MSKYLERKIKWPLLEDNFIITWKLKKKLKLVQKILELSENRMNI